tara:strand:+ start:75 stop:545 length:471 start_codon:yes stop_codon:yes gene_type:complete
MKTLIYDNLLTEDECNFAIDFYKKLEHEAVKYRNVYPLSILKDEMNYLQTKLSKISKEFNAEIDWIQIVKWPIGSYQNLHFDDVNEETILSSITYLNDNFEGGRTYFEDGTTFIPKKGRGIFFDGQYYKHGVAKVENDIRYVVATWYKKLNTNERI